jgi:FixJ family two-component response regulator
MLSGKGDEVNILNSVQHGAKGFIGKPFCSEKLLQYINNSPSIKNHCQSPSGSE